MKKDITAAQRGEPHGAGREPIPPECVSTRHHVLEKVSSNERAPQDEERVMDAGIARGFSDIIATRSVNLFGCLVGPLALWAVIVQTAPGRVTATSYDDARPVLMTIAEQKLPSELRGTDETHRRSGWAAWLARHEADVRARLTRGDQDTIVNWLLLGTSFTDRPRPLLAMDGRPQESASTASVGALRPEAGEIIVARARDLVAALAVSGEDERRRFVRRSLESRGYRFETAADRRRVERHLLAEVDRQSQERQLYARDLAEVQELADLGEYVPAQSKLATLFRGRGLSLDTSLTIGFAVERALQFAYQRKLMTPGSVRRVAVVGPGVDFADKNSGYDFYPQQTLQPFALLDALLRQKLATAPGDVEVVTFDISSRVNEHLRAARERAARHAPYCVHLTLDRAVPWTPDLLNYRAHLGDRVGASSTAADAPLVASTLDDRIMCVDPKMVNRVAPEDLDIVYKRLAGPPFDLIVATNVLVYYDVFEQSLAITNIERMLRPGGLLLVTEVLALLPPSRLSSAGSLGVPYSELPHDGAQLQWYQRLPD